MFVYGKVLVRVVILFALIAAAMVISAPATPVRCNNTCQHHCEVLYQQCIQRCTTQACVTGCASSVALCSGDCCL